MSPRAYGLFGPADVAGLSGLEVLKRIVAGQLPSPPISETLGFDLVEVEKGRAVFEGVPGVRHYNPIGVVHAGFAATLVDSAMACSIHSMLEPGEAYTTLEFKISLLRPITDKTGPIRATGTALQKSRRAGFAEGRVEDAEGRLLAHATSTCIVLPATN